MLAAALLAVALMAAAAAAAPWERADEEVRHLYEAWKAEPGRPGRNGGDDRLRLEVFRDNLRYIDARNAEADAGLHGFRLGLTPFADLTLEEFRGRVLGFQLQSPRRNDTVDEDEDEDGFGDQLAAVPTAVDWRKSGAVTGVKNQRSCGPYLSPLRS
jgi:hypothetical protein